MKFTTISLLLGIGILGVVPLSAQRAVAGPEVKAEEFNGDLRDLPEVRPVVGRMPRSVMNRRRPSRPLNANVTEPLAQALQLAPMPSPLANFAGLNNNDNTDFEFFPSDVNGDVGPNHYIQATNSMFAIYSKSGTLLKKFSENQLFASTGSNVCATSGQGDPVALYDRLNDRWLVSFFAFGFDSNGFDISPYFECIAVSKTGDPVGGGWWLYRFRMDPGGANLPPVGVFADYPKFGIWPDGCLYMSANEFDDTQSTTPFVGTLAVSFNRNELEAGVASPHWGIVYLSNPNDPFTMIPSNFLGGSSSLPPAGTPNYFVSQGGAPPFSWEVRKFTPASTCGGGGTLSGPTLVSELQFRNPPNDTNLIPQPGTKTLIDSLDDRIMQKVQYRNINGAESLWVVHVAQTSASSTVFPHWAQINVTGGKISTAPVQEQFYTPDTKLYRWTPSLAVDQSGNMAMGYTTSNGSVPNFPSIAYAGRLATDPLNTLPQNETVMIAGGGSQTTVDSNGDPTQRWGDYSSMSMDPTDDCTFWYTNMYYINQSDGANGNWSTRIGSFKFPGCGQSQPTTGTPAVVSLTPATGTTTQASYSAVFTNTAGYQNFQILDILVNNVLDGRQACYIAIQPTGATTANVFLVDDAGDAGGPYRTMQIPSSSIVSNNQCSVQAAGSSILGNGNQLTLNLTITFGSTFAGYKVFYVSAGDKSGANTGWQALGTWGVPTPQFTGPGVGFPGVNPGRSASTNSPVTYAFSFTDTLGVADIAVANVLINTAIDGRRGCYLAFVNTVLPGEAGPRLNLVDDAGDAGGPFQSLVLSSLGGSIGNSQCTVSGSVSSSGNTLTLTLNIALNHSFAGNQIVFMATRSNTLSSGWQSVGSITVP